MNLFNKKNLVAFAFFLLIFLPTQVFAGLQSNGVNCAVSPDGTKCGIDVPPVSSCDAGYYCQSGVCSQQQWLPNGSADPNGFDANYCPVSGSSDLCCGSGVTVPTCVQAGVGTCDNPYPIPPSGSLSASPTSASTNQTSNITWSCGGGSTSALDPFSGNNMSGNQNTPVFNNPGTYFYTLNCYEAGYQTAQQSVSIDVSSGGSADFLISGLTPASQTISQGQSASYTGTITSQNGMSGVVTLSDYYTPPNNSSTSFSPSNSITVPANGSANFTYTISTAANTPATSYSIGVQASWNGITKNDSGFLTVNTTSSTLRWTCSNFSAPSRVTAGSTFNVTLTATNAGSDTWQTSSLYRLGIYGGYPDWVNPNSPNSLDWKTRWEMPQSSVLPGQSVTFTNIPVLAPSTPGTYNDFTFQMIEDNVNWFNGVANCKQTMTVTAAANSNGSCGSANGKTYANGSSSYGADTQCSAGTPSNTSFPTAGNTVSWTCSGTNGGSASPSCSASQTASLVSGACGTANKAYAYNASSYGSDTFCSTGTASPSSPAFPTQGNTTSWTCQGSGGGSNASCSALRNGAPVNGIPSVPGNPSGGSYPPGTSGWPPGTVPGSFCSSGSLSGGVPSFPGAGNCVPWTCLGSGGGSNGTGSACVGSGTYSVTVAKTVGGSVTSADGHISCGTTCSYTYTQGASVTLQAVPDSVNWKFVGWTGDCSGSSSATLTVNAAKSCTAIFAPRPFQYQEF